MAEEVFEIFDEENKLIGRAPRSEVHKRGLYHRAVTVFIVNKKGQIYLQKRSENKDTEPGMWTYGCGEHVKPGESYSDAVKRGLKEELGLENAKISRIRSVKLIHIDHKNGLVDNEFDELHVGISEGPFNLNSEEISDGKFFSVEKIDNHIKNKSMRFTLFFLLMWPDFKKIHQNIKLVS